MSLFKLNRKALGFGKPKTTALTERSTGVLSQRLRWLAFFFIAYPLLDVNQIIGEEIMSRRLVLEDWKFKVKTFIDSFQGDKEDKTINIVDECAEVQEISDCVESLEAFEGWLDFQIKGELEKEEEMLPDEGNPLHEVGA